MFRIIRIDKLIRYTASITLALSVGAFMLFEYWFGSLSLLRLITISSIVSATIVYVLVSRFFSRFIWRILKFFNKSLYPDLNGSWDGKITTEDGIIIPVRCVIRQRLLDTEIDVHGETVKSITLESTPIIVSGQKKLYYTYQASPKNVSFGSYFGSTLFDVREVNNSVQLSGTYYTDRKTTGRIDLKKNGNKSSVDVSYY